MIYVIMGHSFSNRRLFSKKHLLVKPYLVHVVEAFPDSNLENKFEKARLSAEKILNEYMDND
jgi:hypothetical protein